MMNENLKFSVIKPLIESSFLLRCAALKLNKENKEYRTGYNLHKQRHE